MGRWSTSVASGRGLCIRWLVVAVWGFQQQAGGRRGWWWSGVNYHPPAAQPPPHACPPPPAPPPSISHPKTPKPQNPIQINCDITS